MIELKGKQISKLEFKPKKLGDLLYFEGPLLSLYSDAHNPNKYYLYKWTDCDESFNRWLILPVNRIELISFLEKELSLLTLFSNSESLYCFDMDDNQSVSRLMETSAEYLPRTYLPREDSFFSEEKYTKFASTVSRLVMDSSLLQVFNLVLIELDKVRKDYRDTNQRIRLLLELVEKGQRKESNMGAYFPNNSKTRQINETIFN